MKPIISILLKPVRLLWQLIRLPLDFLLLTFHYIKGLLWLSGTTLKLRVFVRHKGQPGEYFNQLLTERKEGSPLPGWPFGCFSEKTASGSTLCIPGRKYGNTFVFRSLCPDATREQGACSGCACNENLQMSKFYWSPPLPRLFGVGLLLCMLWGALGYGTYKLLPNTSIAERKKAEVFFAKGQQWMEEEQYDKAALAFQNSIKKHAKDSEIRFEYAHCLMKLNWYEEAFDEFKASVRISPEFWQSHLELAKLMMQAQQWKVSVAHAKKVCEHKPDLFEAYALWITALLADDQTDEAKTVLKQGISSCKLEDLESILEVAGLSSRMMEWVQAQSYYQEALVLDPESIPARIGLAGILTRQSQWDKSKAMIDQILEKDPVNWQAILCNAEWFMAQKEWERAITEYGSLSLLYPQAPYPRIKMAWILSMILDQKDRGLAVVDEVLTRYPDNQEALLLCAQIHFEHQRYRLAVAKAERIKMEGRKEHVLHAQSILAQSYGKLNDYVKSITFCKKVLESEPNNFTIKLNLAYGIHQQGDSETALVLYKEAAALNPNSHLPDMYSGNIHNQKGDLEAALQMYEHAHQKNSEDSMVTNNLATLLIKRGETADIERAFNLMKNRIESNDKHPMMLDTFGWILFHKGELDEAKDYLEKATAQKSDHPLLFYHLGKTYFQLNEAKQAQIAFEKALSINTHFKEAPDAIRLLAILNDQ